MEGQLLQLLGLLRVVMAWLHLRTVIYMEIFQLGRYADSHLDVRYKQILEFIVEMLFYCIIVCM